MLITPHLPPHILTNLCISDPPCAIQFGLKSNGEEFVQDVLKEFTNHGFTGKFTLEKVKLLAQSESEKAEANSAALQKNKGMISFFPTHWCALLISNAAAIDQGSSRRSSRWMFRTS